MRDHRDKPSQDETETGERIEEDITARMREAEKGYRRSGRGRRSVDWNRPGQRTP